jgi:hypothetical protein
MADQGSNSLAGHGVAQLTSVTVDTYNAELRDKDGFVGDNWQQGSGGSGGSFPSATWLGWL